MSKNLAKELVVGYAAHTLAPQAQAEFERHLESCPDCRQVVAQQHAVWSALEEWQPLPVSPDFDRNLAQRIAQSQQAGWFKRLRSHWTWRPAIPVAVACAALVLAFFIKDDDQPAANGHPRVQIEQQVQHALDDMDMLKQLGVDVTPDRPEKL